ncbi:MAG: hypothetical protein GXP62_07590 [Oligoflexia bacterium]|nr:hypothetical protein [Oligoflexia bacterium]
MANVDTGFGTGTGSTAPLADPYLDTITPPYDMVTGGGTITLTGGNFDASTVVRFGTSDATVLSWTQNELTVTAPPAHLAGLEDISVRTDAGSATLIDAFRYIADGTGLNGVIGYLRYTEYMGDYWGSTPADPMVEAALLFQEPNALNSWQIYGPSVDDCELNYDYSGSPSVGLDMGVDQIELSGGGYAFDVPWDAGLDAYYAQLDGSEFAFATGYDMQTVSPDTLPSFEVVDLVRTPTSSLRVLTPNLEGSEVVYVQSSFTLTWTGGSGDIVLIKLGLQNSAGSGYLEELDCVANDDGSFTVPDDWTVWPTGRQIDIWVETARQPDSTLPFNGSDSDVLGIYSKIGAAFTE